MSCDCRYSDPSPKPGDTIAALWRKINQILNDQFATNHPPSPADWQYNSMFKTAQILDEACG